jgi:hypothetical protein
VILLGHEAWSHLHPGYSSGLEQLVVGYQSVLSYSFIGHHHKDHPILHQHNSLPLSLSLASPPLLRTRRGGSYLRQYSLGDDLSLDYIQFRAEDYVGYRVDYCLGEVYGRLTLGNARAFLQEVSSRQHLYDRMVAPYLAADQPDTVCGTARFQPQADLVMFCKGSEG